MVTKGKGKKGGDEKKGKGKGKGKEPELRLKLGKETVKELGDDDLSKAAGGLFRIVGVARVGAALRSVPIPTPESGTACALYLCQKTWTCNLECI
jgi:hypothetical protein